MSSEALPVQDRVERYTFEERLCHWLTGFSYLYCMATGLAFYSPYLFWIAIALGGGPTSRFRLWGKGTPDSASMRACVGRPAPLAKPYVRRKNEHESICIPATQRMTGDD